MLAADRLLDIGPGPGERGGEIVAYGPPTQIANDPTSLTGAYLSGRKRVDTPSPAAPGGWGCRRASPHRRPPAQPAGRRSGDPLQRLVGITGVSGSGKSTLIQDVLFPALAKHFGQRPSRPAPLMAWWAWIS